MDKLTYFKYLGEQNLGTRAETTESILDLRSEFDLCSTLGEPEEFKNELLLASTLEEFHQYFMAFIR